MSDHIHWAFVDLVLDGAVEHVERLAGTLVQELVQQEREPEEKNRRWTIISLDKYGKTFTLAFCFSCVS